MSNLLLIATLYTGLFGAHVRAVEDGGTYHIVYLDGGAVHYAEMNGTAQQYGIPNAGAAMHFYPAIAVLPSGEVHLAWTGDDWSSIKYSTGVPFGDTSIVMTSGGRDTNRPSMEVIDGKVNLVAQNGYGIRLAIDGVDAGEIYHNDPLEPQWPVLDGSVLAFASYFGCTGKDEVTIMPLDGRPHCPQVVDRYPAGVDLAWPHMVWLEWSDPAVNPPGGFDLMRYVNLEDVTTSVLYDGLIGDSELPPAPRIAAKGDDWLACWNKFRPEDPMVFCSSNHLSRFKNTKALGRGMDPDVIALPNGWAVVYSNESREIVVDEFFEGHIAPTATPSPSPSPVATQGPTPTPTAVPDDEPMSEKATIAAIIALILALLLGSLS